MTKLIITPKKISELNPTDDTFWISSGELGAKDKWVTIMENYYIKDEARIELSDYRANLIIENGNSENYLYWKERWSRLLSSFMSQEIKCIVMNFKTYIT